VFAFDFSCAPRVACLVASGAFAAVAAGAVFAQSAVPAASTAELDPVQVRGNYLNGVGTSDAASAGTVTSRVIESRPTLRPAEVLEFVPGVIVTQHSGDGKANQYYLRGFNLDHGTDFATWVDGMPVRETSVGIYADHQLEWTPWLRSVVGLRADRFFVEHTSSIAFNSGNRSAGLVSPKLSLVFGPWSKTETFANYGWGYHSNDARGATAKVKPKEFNADPSDPNAATEPSPLLVRSKGGELGLRSEIVPGLQTSLALWQLRLGSELVFSGDAGDTEASRPSTREGIEFSNHYLATPWLLLDGDLAWSRSRFTIDDPATPGRFIPGSVETVVSLGASVVELGPWFGHFQLRYFGPRPLIEDNSVRSASTTLAYLRVGYRVAPNVRIALDVFNLFDRKASDIEYYYASRLKGEPAAGVADVHFHPVEPRRVRLTLTAQF